jgi:hypothetical protein
MPEKPLTQASFVAVGASGELIFSAHGARFAVDVDDALERAELEAKQIKAESFDMQQPAAGQSLPISQIQTLIRAGAEPARVAQRYGLSPALVRRFSASVQTEKQYAIEQFLAVPAPKESHVHTMAELIERTLATARIGMETVQWKATRRGIEPWKISAEFDSAGRRLRAEWTWNMHDNAVACLNSAAKRLIGELSPRDREKGGDTANVAGELDDAFSIVLGIPGDSIRSARIERAVSAWGSDGSESPSTAGDTAQSGTHGQAPGLTPVSPRNSERQDSDRPDTPGQTNSLRSLQPAQTPQTSQAPSKPQTSPKPQPDHSGQRNRGELGHTQPPKSVADDAAFDMPSLSAAPDAHAAKPNRSPHLDDAHSPANAAVMHAEPSLFPGVQPDAGTAAGSSAGTAEVDDVDERGKNPARKNAKPDSSKPSKRKSRRSAVPSWDEILFGD